MYSCVVVYATFKARLSGVLPGEPAFFITFTQRHRFRGIDDGGMVSFNNIYEIEIKKKTQINKQCDHTICFYPAFWNVKLYNKQNKNPPTLE